MILSVLISLIDAVVVIFLFSRLPPFIPFFNNLPWGVERLAPTNILFFFISTFFIVIIVNSILCSILYRKYTFISRILSMTLFLYVFLGSLSLLQIIFSVF